MGPSRHIAMSLAAMLLSACGGSGSSTSPDPLPSVSDDPTSVAVTEPRSSGASGNLGFFQVGSSRFEFSESESCSIDTPRARGTFLGVDSDGRSAVLVVEADVDLGESISLRVDQTSFDATPPTGAPRFDASNRDDGSGTGTLSIDIVDGTLAGSGYGIDRDVVNSPRADPFEGVERINFDVTCS